MVTKKEDAIRAGESLLEALAGLREAVRGAEAATKRALAMVDKGVDAEVALAEIHPSSVRHSLNEALDAAEQARHEMRVLVFAVLLERGVSVSELARAFGFSRQMAARYAKEAREVY